MGESEVRLCELGPLELEVRTERLPIRGRRAATAVSRLSIAAPVACSKLDLVGAIWGPDSPRTAYQSLFNTIADLRRLMGAETIETTADGYRLASDVASDRREFSRRLALAERKYRNHPGEALSEIEKAKALWRGEPYSGFAHGDWLIEADAARLNEVYEQFRRVEAAALAGSGRHDEAIALLSQILAASPLDEDAWITLIDSFRETGRPVLALQAVRRAVNALRDEGLTPSPSLRRIERELTRVPKVGIVAVEQRTEPGKAMSEQEDWNVVHRLGSWELTILFPGDYSLLTDFELKSPYSDRYLGTVGTPEMIREIIDKPDEIVPFWVSDLVLVDELNEDTLVAAVSALIDRGEVERALDFAPPDLEDLYQRGATEQREGYN